MDDAKVEALVAEVADGRTDLVFKLVEAGCAADFRDVGGISLVQHCAYYGDVSAVRFLLSRGAALESRGNYDLNGAAFHGHWQLCRFLLEQGADVNHAAADTGETALHSALCKSDRVVYDRVLEVLLAAGADPNVATKPGVETGAFMRDCRTKGETALHRAAAYGEVETVQMLLDAGAVVDARDMNGDTPLSWGSWYSRPDPILRLLLHGEYRIRSERRSMKANLVGRPHS